jgi:S1-C subfamily serine protease
MKILTTSARVSRVDKGTSAHYVLSPTLRRKISDDSVVINQKGQLVGLTQTEQLESGNVRNMAHTASLVYPISDARRLADRIISTKNTSRGWLGLSGVSITELTIDERNAFVSWPKLPSQGIVVSKVEPQSPAALAGLMPNDVLVTFNNQPVTSTDQFSQILALTPIGEATEVQALRDGNTVKVQVKLAPRPVIVVKQVTIQGVAAAVQDLRYRIAILQNELDSQQRKAAAMPEGQQRQEAETKLKQIRELLEVQKSALAQLDTENTVTLTPAPAASANRAWSFALQLRMGLATQELTDQLRTFFGVPQNQGVLISTVKAGGLGETSGIKAGDILIELNGTAITSTMSYQTVLNRVTPGKTVKAVVLRNKVRQEIMLEIPDQPHSQLNLPVNRKPLADL